MSFGKGFFKVNSGWHLAQSAKNQGQNIDTKPADYLCLRSLDCTKEKEFFCPCLKASWNGFDRKKQKRNRKNVKKQNLFRIECQWIYVICIDFTYVLKGYLALKKLGSSF